MKVVGLIVEYNPLHTGHIYHFNTVKQKSNADLIISVMSSTLTMRGEISVFDKFTKAKQALNINNNIVVELFGILALNNADYFSLYAVKILSNLKVDEIWIGSELDDASIYEKYHNTLRTTKYNDLISKYLKMGYSYKVSSNLSFKDLDLEELKSNDILGLFYYKAIKDLNLNIKLKTIKRIGNDYNDSDLKESYSSSKSIRNTNMDFSSYVNEEVLNDYNQFGFYDMEKLFNYLKYKILSSSTSELKEYKFISDGLWNKLYQIKDFTSFNEFVLHLSNKRFTNSKIRRILISIIFNIKKEQTINPLDLDFIRVLAFDELGRKYLNKIKKDICVYTNIKDNINEILDQELKITRLIDHIYQKNLIKQEFNKPIIKK